MPDPKPLNDVAQEFAGELADTVSRFLDEDCTFTSLAVEPGRFIVQERGEGIPLKVNSQPLLILSVEYRCSWDRSETYLAVEFSEIKVFARRQQGEPLFHYDFIREPSSPHVPCAHIQVGAHRDEFTHALGYAGNASRRAKTRAAAPPDKPPRIAQVHFPVGGPRFRPCLEDVLAMIREEFGIDTAPDWQEVIESGRAQWRRRQTATAVRDCPTEAVRVLRELGYSVEAGPRAQTGEDRRRLTQP